MNTCARALTRRLAEHGGWASRNELGRVGDYSEARVDEELADLVVAGNVLYNPRGREYKLAGTPLARKALQQMLANGDQRRVLGAQSADKATYRMGLAVRARDFSGAELLVMGEVQMPYPAGQDELARMAWQISQWDQAMARMDAVAAVPPKPPTA